MRRIMLWIMIAALLAAGFGCKKRSASEGMAFDDVPLETILERIYTEADLELPERVTAEITQENMSYYLGTDTLEFSEAIASEAMLNVIPFSLCLLRVPDKADAKEAARVIQENADPNKWICVGVSGDQVRTAYEGDVVMLVMAEEAVDLVAAFRRLAAS